MSFLIILVICLFAYDPLRIYVNAKADAMREETRKLKLENDAKEQK